LRALGTKSQTVVAGGEGERGIDGGRDEWRDEGREPSLVYAMLVYASPTHTHNTPTHQDTYHLLELLADFLLLALLQGGDLAEGPQQHRLPENAHRVAIQVQLTEKARGFRV
jgi:hypothetical protein